MKPIQVAILSIVFGFCICTIQSAAAQSAGTFSFGCAGQARSRSLVGKALERRVLASIDTARFSKTRVTVTLILLGDRNPPLQDFAPEELTDGLSLVGQDFPAGLSFAVSGGTTINQQCVYNYIARITTRGVDLENGNTLRTATTDSEITITEQMFGRTIFHNPTPAAAR